MNDLSIKGVVLQILPEETGTSKAGKEWKKKEFVIETQDQYPKKVAFTLFGDKTDLLMKIGTGMNVDVSFNVESREYNGRWFHNINAWKILSDDLQKSAADLPPEFEEAPPPPGAGDEDLPF